MKSFHLIFFFFAEYTAEATNKFNGRFWAFDWMVTFSQLQDFEQLIALTVIL